MKKNLRLAVLSGLLLIALTVNAAFPRPAQADEVPPPPPETSEPAPTDPEPTDPPPTEEPAQVAPTEVAPGEATTEETAQPVILTDMPAETELVVLDENGEAVALTTTEAALIIATGDPMWCPAGILPGGVGCTTPFADFNGVGGLLDILQNNPVQFSGPGTIFIAFDYTSAGDGAVTIDGNDGYGIEDLTIQGGWDFGLNQYSGAPTTIEDALAVLNWDYDVTLNDLLFDGTSLTVETSGDIELNNVEVRDNGVGYGADLDNTAGTNSTIEVNSSSFHDNLTIGIQALSNGGITLTDVDAYGNDGAGAVLDNSGSAFAGTVTIWTSSFNGNGGTGLDVNSKGSILTVDIEASGNGDYGAVLDNSLADDPQSVTVGYLYGNEFNNNYNSGLTVLSQGDITVYQATANNNGHTSNLAGAGAYLDNTYGNGNTFVYNYNIYTDQYGEFSGNYSDGLDVYSNGNVELWYVIAENNGNSGNASDFWGIGTYIDNCNWAVVSCDGTGWVEVNDSEFDLNYSTGLFAYSAGAIELSGGTANDNGDGAITDPAWGMGAYLDNSDGTGGVTITGGGLGSFAAGGNYSDGLNVYSTGDIYVSYVFAEENGLTGNADNAYGNGAVLDNCLWDATECAGSGYVYVLASEFNDNYADGLQAFASENIWLNYYVSANDNGQSLTLGSGALLVNNFNGSTGSILLYGPITLNNNYNTGLIAQSNGDIYMTGVEGNFNTDAGATVTTSSGSVTIDESMFNSNGLYGVLAVAEDDVELTDVEANTNGAFGAQIITTAGAVSIDQATFFDNAVSGLTVSAVEDISLIGVDASQNATYGALLNTTAGGVSVDSGTFNLNTASFGLLVTAADDISLGNVAANQNGSHGASLTTTISGDISLSEVEASENTTFGVGLTTPNGAVTIDQAVFYNNTSFGLSATATDDIVLDGVDANDNGIFGAQLTTTGGGAEIDSSSFDWNTLFGLSVSAAQDIALADVSASDNGSYGAHLTTTGGGASIDTGTFDGNGLYGLEVAVTGNVGATDVSASDNANFGAAFTSTAGSVSIDPSYFNDNGLFGLYVFADQQILLASVGAHDNSSFGADLTSSAGGIEVLTSGFTGNGANGFDADAAGTIELTGVNASDNATYGALVITDSNLTVAGGSFDWNTAGFGLDGTAKYAISLAGTQASHNGGAGAVLTTTDGGNIRVEGGLFQGNAGDGLYIASSADAAALCITSIDNSGYGLNATAPGSLWLKLGDLSGNTLGPMDVSGVGVFNLHDVNCGPQEPELKPLPAPPALPWAVFHVAGGDSHGLNCSEFGGTVLILPTWDHVSIPCPVTGDATLKAVPDTDLPGELGENYAYVSGMDVQVQPPPEGEMTVDFLMPPSGSVSNLVILHWDGSAWVDRGGIPMPDNFLEISTQETGVYVLASQ